MLDFNNTEIAFSAKSQSELKNAYLLFNTIKYPWLVKCASVVSNIALNIHFPLGWAVKPTLYKQFVGGETLQDCTKAIDHLRKFNVRSTLDFSAEGEQTPEGIQATFEETIRSIDFAKGNDNLAYAVFKPSTIITDELLAKVSEKQEELTIEEVKAYREFKERFMAFCQRAYDNDVRLIVDAEDYCFQDAIDSLTDEAMRRYNKKRAIVFATLQMYRHDRMPYLRRILDDAKEKGYIAGVNVAPIWKPSVPGQLLWDIPIRSVRISRQRTRTSTRLSASQWIISTVSKCLWGRIMKRATINWPS